VTTTSPPWLTVDFLTGVLFTLIGALGLWYSREWSMGTLAMMDSGFFPRVLSAFILAAGLGLLAAGLVGHGHAVPGWGWRPLLGVTAAVVAFGLTVERLGLAVAILAVVGIGGFAGTRLRPVAFVALWVGLTALCATIFIWGVALPLRVWPF
jgi:hypothetical protein